MNCLVKIASLSQARRIWDKCGRDVESEQKENRRESKIQSAVQTVSVFLPAAG